ncbi:mRNA polyadenylation factor [Lithospermum erythrorhizon]|uniref:mRNA polyadenylation factor n=1 Tax=Lithospermum erythrorhizon TaxID=34254 RepID=A0AAV3Q0Y0_LITER
MYSVDSWVFDVYFVVANDIYLCHRYRIDGQGKPVYSIQRKRSYSASCVSPIAKSYHCTTKCFTDTWIYHRALHEKGNSSAFIQKDNKKWTCLVLNSWRTSICNVSMLAIYLVQKDHFKEFFKPELDMHGYEALFTWKSTKGCIDKKNTIERCATFFRKDEFSLVEKYEEKAALDGTVKQSLVPKAATSLKKRQLVCVTNTHINVLEKHKDVHLWQVDTLVKGIEEIAINDKIPILICGDFNSIPQSAPHELIVKGSVDFNHPDIAAMLVKESIDPNDQVVSTVPFGILQQLNHMTHNLKLASAYCSLAKAIIENCLPVEKYWLTVDLKKKEPKFTQVIKDSSATHDYIFYSEDALATEGVLELLDKGGCTNNLKIPSPAWSSDHIALQASFTFKPKMYSLRDHLIILLCFH